MNTNIEIEMCNSQGKKQTTLPVSIFVTSRPFSDRVITSRFRVIGTKGVKQVILFGKHDFPRT